MGAGIRIYNWKDIAQEYKGADILLGNGFSLKLTGHFRYTSLFTEFLKTRTSEERKVFEKLRTKNFETIITKLRDAREINKLFGIRTNEIKDAIESLKKGLLLVIKDNHPRSGQIDREQLKRVSSQFDMFNDIFTLNYDLFLYNNAHIRQGWRGSYHHTLQRLFLGNL